MNIFFAGSENEKHFDTALAPLKAEKLLMSYFYLRNKKQEDLDRFLTKAREKTKYLFLDSGAHTFLAAYGEKSSSVKSKTKPLKPMEYAEEYFLWLEKNAHYFDLVVELDIGSVLESDMNLPLGGGYKIIQDWRKRMCDMGLHDKMFVVSHYIYFSKIFPDWKEEWQRMLEEYPYCAIGDQPPHDILHNHFSVWQKVGNYNRIHGFAETKSPKMKNYPYWSVDSTTWNAGSRYGLLFVYDRKPFIMRGLPRLDRTSEESVKKGVYDFRKNFHLLEEETKKVPFETIFDYTLGATHRDQQNVRAFMAFEKDCTRLWQTRKIDFDKNPPKCLLN